MLKERKKLNITFINPNTEEQIVQAMSGVLAYNLAENDEKVIFNCKDTQELRVKRNRKWER